VNHEDLAKSMSEAYAQVHENQYKGEKSFNPDELAKQFPKNSGVSYGERNRRKDHLQAYPTATTSDGKTYSTDLEAIGGTQTKNKYSPSFARGAHQRNVNTLKKMDRLVKDVQKMPDPKPEKKGTMTTAQQGAMKRRIDKSPYNSKVARMGHQVIKDIQKEQADAMWEAYLAMYEAKYHIDQAKDMKKNIADQGKKMPEGKPKRKLRKQYKGWDKLEKDETEYQKKYGDKPKEKGLADKRGKAKPGVDGYYGKDDKPDGYFKAGHASRYQDPKVKAMVDVMRAKGKGR